VQRALSHDDHDWCMFGKRSHFSCVQREHFLACVERKTHSLRAWKESSLTMIMRGACAERELSLRVWKEIPFFACVERELFFACVEREFSHDHHDRCVCGKRALFACVERELSLCVCGKRVLNARLHSKQNPFRKINARLHSKQNPFRSCTCRAPACV